MFKCVEREGRTAVQTDVIFSEQCAYYKKINFNQQKKNKIFFHLGK